MPEKPRCPTSSDFFYAYMKGWSCGASHRFLDKRLSEHKDDGIKSAYLDGWSAGRVAAKSAGREAEKLYGYSPSILRLQDIESELD